MTRMPRFFCTDITDTTIRITGGDAYHIARVLRMHPGEQLTVCDGLGTDYSTVIRSATAQEVHLEILERCPTLSEPTTQVTLYQGLPKSDKMDWIVQKTVELGIARIVPVTMSRSISRTDAQKAEKKQERWQKIAAEAAGQSGRGCIPIVSPPLSWRQMLAEIIPSQTLLFYEGGGRPLPDLVDSKTAELSIIVGPEGGFSEREVQELKEAGITSATLGKRILRCETAPVAALAAIMCLSGNMT